jgi:hypothetical protein
MQMLTLVNARATLWAFCGIVDRTVADRPVCRSGWLDKMSGHEQEGGRW